ncbi:MAG: dehalogenase [Chloroflexota bacterium]
MLWLVLGLVVGAVFVYFAAGQASGKFHIRWYQWLFGVGAAALYLMAIQNYLGFLDELEPAFANLMLVLMGVPAVILTALTWSAPRIFGGKGKQSTARLP